MPVAGQRRDTGVRPEARVGQMLKDKWRIDALIDVGGMGAVYAATHRNGRRAAIKMLHARYALDPEVRKRFLREGYVANKIGHPGAVAILDDDTADDGAPFLVMELLEGESLSAWLQRTGKLPAADVLAISGQALEVLEVAHANGIVHRDIKPGNIFITRAGHAKVLDFGLARIRDGTISLIPTAAGVVMGTIGYMAPEQARGIPDQIDARADIFAVGAVMFRALTGRRVHEKPTHFDMTIAAMKEPAASIATLLPNAGPRLVEAVDRALAFDRSARWQDARTMFEALRVAFEETRERAAAVTQPARPLAGSAESVDVPIVIDEPSVVVDVAFGPGHDDALERERKRTLEIVEGLSSLSVVIDTEAINKP